MSLFDDIKQMYFLGIGGIGMSALAQYFVSNGIIVSGYDKTPGKMTRQLGRAGIDVLFDDRVNEIPLPFQDKETTLVVYTPAIPDDLTLFKFFKDHGFKIKKRAVVLGAISRTIPTLAVAGTHGKTTTSAILAHLLKQSGYNITAFLGGISENYQSNFIGDGKDACVVEADEFDRSFLELSPELACIISMSADHLDIYNKGQKLKNAFHVFSDKITKDENLFFTQGLALKGNAVGLAEKADYEIQSIEIKNGRYRFNFKTPEETLTALEFAMPGRYNLLNAGIALAMALKFGASPGDLKPALAQFRGIDRRFTYHIQTENLVLIDDYAHHPDELTAVRQAARERFPGEKVTAVFQPHLYSRTRDFAEAFGKSLTSFDEVFLLPIYPAREKPIPGIDAEFVLDKINNPSKKVIEKSAITKSIRRSKSKVFLLLGAGDIGNEVERVKAELCYEN